LNPLALLAVARRYSPPPIDGEPQYLEGLFAQQRRAFDSRVKQLALHPGRRGGKTDLLSKRLVHSMMTYPGSNEWTGYITLTKGTSRRNMAGPLGDLITAYNLPISGPVEVDGQITYTHQNGHRLWLGGVDDLRKAERWRGNKWRRVCIDEAGAWPDDVLRHTVRVILRPALSDLDGDIWIAGTPGAIEKGFWHDITTGKNPKIPQWETHHWTVLDNPYHRYGQPGGRALLEAEEMVANGLTADDPVWIREWMGQWCADPHALIYPFEPLRNSCAALPDVSSPLDWSWVLGVDIGWDDDSAFVLSCSIPGRPEMYIVRTWGQPHMTPSSVAEEIKLCREHLLELGFRSPLVCFDTGGLGKMISKELELVHGLSIYPADKADKAGSIRLFRGGLANGRIKLLGGATGDCSGLAQEWAALPWDDKRHEHHPKFKDHLSDAALYSRRGHWPSEREVQPEDKPSGQAQYEDRKASAHKAHLERMGDLRFRLRNAKGSEIRSIQERIRREEERYDRARN
jgi:hypothetical protein